MENKNLTVLVAHCDDEFLFMFPALQHAKKIVCVTSDIQNPSRVWCKRRKEGFFEVCKLVGAEAVCLDFSSRFFTGMGPDFTKDTSTKQNNEIYRTVEAINKELADAEVIFTHNEWGEYGHIDHSFCNRIAKMTGKPVFTQDVLLQADWYPVKSFKQGRIIKTIENDLDFHNRCVHIYEKYAAWGWTYAAVERTNVIEVGHL